MVINHNLSSIYANRQVKFNGLSLNSSMEKLSSGQKINRAGDDAANLAVSEKMRSQIRGLIQAEKNAENGISFVQTTEGYLQETQDILQRIDRIASHAQFNGMNMLTGRFANPEGSEGSATASMWLHIGANMDQRKQVFIGDMTAVGLGLRQGDGTDGMISLSTSDGANATIGTIDDALKVLNKQRADLGAYQNRLEHATKGLAIGAENLQAAESVIRDTDMASEMVNFTRDNILVQASTSMLAQANQKTQAVMRLLQ